MKVILTARVSNLGQIGDIVEVKNGYAKNFLIPNKKAICQTVNNQKLFDSKKAEFEKANENALSLANQVKNKVFGNNIIIIENASDDGRLYGSVSSAVIATKINEFLKEKIVEKTSVFLSKPIKDIGVYSIKIDLHSDVVFNLKLVVSRSESEVDALIKAEEKSKRQSSQDDTDSSKKAIENNSGEDLQDKDIANESSETKKKKRRLPSKKNEE